MSYNLTEKRQKLKLQLEGHLTEEEVRKRSVHVTKLHIPTIFKSVPDIPNFQDEEKDLNKLTRANKSSKNVDKVTEDQDSENAQLRNNNNRQLRPVRQQLSPTSTVFNFRPNKENASTPRENTYYEIDAPDDTVTLRKTDSGASKDLNEYDVPSSRLQSNENTNLGTNSSKSISNDSSKTTLFKKNNVVLKSLSIKDDKDNPLSPKSPMFETLQNNPVLKRSGSRVGFYAKEELEKQNSSTTDASTNPVAEDYLYMAAQVGTNLKEMYDNITLDKKEQKGDKENDKINKKLLEEDHYENIEVIRKNYLDLNNNKPPIPSVRINKKPIPALRQKAN